MSERSQLQNTTRIAIAALIIALLSHFFSYHQTQDALKRVAVLEKRNATLDSIQQSHLKKSDSIREQRLYQNSLAAYEKAASLAFTQNQNLRNSGDQFLLVKNNCSGPMRFAIAFRGLNKTWFTEGMLGLESRESLRIWGVDSSASVYVYAEAPVRINQEKLVDLNAVNLSVDTASDFIFTGNTPPPHKTAFRVAYHEVNPTLDSQIIFTDP
jgi:hypothetical protein